MGIDAFTQQMTAYNYNPTAAASTLSWAQTSPQAAGFANAQWSPSLLTSVSNQSIQYYSDPYCGTERGALQTLAPGATNNSAAITSSSFVSFRILTTLSGGLQSWSNCSPEMAANSVCSYAGGLASTQRAQTSHAMAGDLNGQPCEAFLDFQANNALSVACWNGTQWQNVGAPGFATTVQAGAFAIAFDHSNRPYVAFPDSSQSGGYTVMHWNGSAWILVGTAGGGGPGSSVVSLAATSPSNVYFAYSDGFSGAKLTVMKYGGTSWSALGGAAFTPGAATGTSLALDSLGRPWVGYQDAANSSNATVQYWDGSAWCVVGAAGFSGAFALGSSLVLDSTDHPVFASYDFTGGTVWRFNGSSWQQLGSSLSSTTLYSLKIARDASDKLIVAFAEQITRTGEVTVRQWNGVSWNLIGPQGFSIGSTNQVDLAVSPTGQLYIGNSDFIVNNLFFLQRYDP